MNISIKLTPDLKSIFTKLTGDVSEGIHAGMSWLIGTLEAWSVKFTPTDTSNLVNSITSYITGSGEEGVLKATAPYSKYVHEGTGLYGPHHQMIVIKPKDKKALHWPGARHPVGKVVQKGMKGTPFFNLAIGETDEQKEFEAGLQNYLTGKGWA